MRFVFGTLLLLHGLVHLVGFIGPFELIRRLPYQVSLLGEQLAASDLRAKLLGLLWLCTAAAFAVAAAGVFGDSAWWATYTAVVAGFSLLLCVLGWPGSKIGVPVNLTVLLVLLMATRPGMSAYLLGWVRLLP